ncbi:hypothetical protein [Endozoicomonas sp. SCSIO W0465]|uniref:hypothetical protein n=1 Tax=Endozoicomonas sp. SCSIO W0465 TaxID=2918516 RepID=UPI0020761B4F|nr:hypothetical protein [Endozoicomonas sp. SCSIO W0465]USE34256.1 hypothetical protein MJO57_19085 [Endozoicomonas sp. SCSIO W0465]
MDLSNKLTSFDPFISDYCAGSLDLLEQTYDCCLSEPCMTYKGLSAQALNTPVSVYHNQSDKLEDNDHPFNLLHEYDVEPLTLPDTANFFSTDIPDMPKSVLDEYVPWSSCDESVDDALSIIPGIPFIQPVRLSGSEPEISEPTPAYHQNPGGQLTNLTGRISDPENYRTVSVVNPPNLHQTSSDVQTTPAEETVEGNCSRFGYKREQYNEKKQDFEKRKLINQHRRERYRERMKDPE